jgi:protein-S-isoprenylcysteine O-methyltransferase Ste14
MQASFSRTQGGRANTVRRGAFFAYTAHKSGHPVPKSLVKTLIFTVLVPGTVTVVVPYRLLASGARPQSTLGLVGILPIALGAALYLWCAWDFASAGRGTPAPVDPPKVLVSRGPYRVVRNPMYVGVLLILLGEGIVFASQTILGYALLAWLFFHLFVVFYEEPTLRRKFGAFYEEYCRTVPRWIPRPRRASRPAGRR